MVNYKDLGLVNTRDMFAKANSIYALRAFDIRLMALDMSCGRWGGNLKSEVFRRAKSEVVVSPQ